MDIEWTEEMERLNGIIAPWLEKRMREDAPQEVKDAEKKFNELHDAEYERQLRLEGYID